MTKLWGNAAHVSRKRLSGKSLTFGDVGDPQSKVVELTSEGAVTAPSWSCRAMPTTR